MDYNIVAALVKDMVDTEPRIDVVRGKNNTFFAIAYNLKDEVYWQIDPADAEVYSIRSIPHKPFIIKIKPLKKNISGIVTDVMGTQLTFNI